MNTTSTTKLIKAADVKVDDVLSVLGTVEDIIVDQLGRLHFKVRRPYGTLGTCIREKNAMVKVDA